MLFNLAQVTFPVHYEKSFVPTFFKVSIAALFDNLSLKEEIIVLGKKYGTRVELWIQKSIRTL